MGTEGDTGDGVRRESSLDPARSETPSTHRRSMHGTWEIPPPGPALTGWTCQGMLLAMSLAGTEVGSRTAALYSRSSRTQRELWRLWREGGRPRGTRCGLPRSGHRAG